MTRSTKKLFLPDIYFKKGYFRRLLVGVNNDHEVGFRALVTLLLQTELPDMFLKLEIRKLCPWYIGGENSEINSIKR